MANGDLNAEGETYHLALARIATALTIEEARSFARLALAEFRSGPPRMAIALHAISTERRRQIREKGWDELHDDAEHDGGELAAAGSCYAMHAADVLNPYSQGDGCVARGEGAPIGWPFEPQHWKPTGTADNQTGAIRDLVKAGALIVAEIERTYRARRRCEACGSTSNEHGYIHHKPNCPVDKPRPVAP